jgi:hypothetical protein
MDFNGAVVSQGDHNILESALCSSLSTGHVYTQALSEQQRGDVVGSIARQESSVLQVVVADKGAPLAAFRFY